MLNFGDTVDGVDNLLPLAAQLHLIRKMLPAATAAHREMLASRGYPFRARLHHAHNLPFRHMIFSFW